MKYLIDTLLENIIRLKSPIVVGLDPVIDKIPFVYFESYEDSFEGVACAIFDFNKDVIDAIAPLVPVVKPQIAFYEMLGSAGILCFEKTVQYAKQQGLIVIEDGKRNDIGNTAVAYANGHLGTIKLNNKTVQSSFDVDFLTVTPFLGSESLDPFIKVAKENNKGLFILVRTSNEGSGMIQDAYDNNGRNVSEIVSDYVYENASNYLGNSGYSSIGAVVGATYPKEALKLRKIMKNSLFLVPGYGAQGGAADDIIPCFNPDGLGAVVNSSRGILYSYLSKHDRGCSRTQYKDAVFNSTTQMKSEIYNTLKNTYPNMVY